MISSQHLGQSYTNYGRWGGMSWDGPGMTAVYILRDFGDVE